MYRKRQNMYISELMKLDLLDRLPVLRTMSLSLSRNKIKWIFKRESIKKQFVIVDFYTHCTNASIGYVMIILNHIFQAVKV